MSPKRAPSARRAAPAALSDHVRIVPLWVPGELVAPAPGIAAPPPPTLSYRGGPLLSAVEVFTVFWGSAWNAAPQRTLMGTLNAFCQFVVTSPYVDQLAEYATPSSKIGHGRFVGTVAVTAPAPGASVTDNTLRQMLQQHLASDEAFPALTANTLYFVFLPPGVAVVAGGSRSCQTFCGYHDQIEGKVFYAVVPYPNCAGCLGGLAPLDALTSVSSHELAEAITDPIPAQGWYDDYHGEIGDVCAWQQKRLGAYTVQLLWSNRAGACV